MRESARARARRETRDLMIIFLKKVLFRWELCTLTCSDETNVAVPEYTLWNRSYRVVIGGRAMEPSPPAVGTYKPLRQGHQLHIECGLVMRTRARPFKYSGSRPSSSRRRRRRRAGSSGRGRRMSRTAARCSSERSSSIPPGSTIRIEVGECHRGRRGGMREESGNNEGFPLSISRWVHGPPVDFY